MLRSPYAVVLAYLLSEQSLTSLNGTPPSERHGNLSVYAAQASPRPLAGPGGASAPPTRDWSGADERNPPEAAPAASCCPLLCLPSQLVGRSRAETPEGSRPAFAWGDLARGSNPYPSDYRTAFASSLIPYPPSHRRPPYGGPTPRGGRRAYHVPRTDHGWCRLCLFADGPTATAGEGGYPCTWPRTVLVQAYQHLWLAGSHDVSRQFT